MSQEGTRVHGEGTEGTDAVARVGRSSFHKETDITD